MMLFVVAELPIFEDETMRKTQKIMAIISVCMLPFLVTDVIADCVQSSKLETVCSKGSCELDIKGNAFCSKYRDGAAISDDHGRVACGKGNCVADSSGEIRCSSVEGGWAAVDAHNNFKCEGGCVPASKNNCVSL